MKVKPFLDIIGVPFGLGGEKHGAALGPGALMGHGLAESLIGLASTVRYISVIEDARDAHVLSTQTAPRGRTHSRDAVQLVSALAGAQVFRAHRLGHFPLVIGGDHAVSIGTLPQLLDPALTHGRKVGCVWVDAHFDAHTTKTTHSCYANGFPLASALGRGPRMFGSYRRNEFGVLKRLHFAPKHILHIGAGESDCEEEEIALLTKLQVPTVTMQDIHRGGPDTFMSKLATLLNHVDDVVFTFDLDAVRMDYAPAVSFPSKSGMLPVHIALIAKLIAKSRKLRQIEIMEYNPDFEKRNVNFSPITAHLVFSVLQELLA